MSHDVFISHSHEEADIAMSVVKGLEKKNIKCWISSRDIPAGSDYAEQIIYGINKSRIVVLILSSNTSRSPHVIRELNRALNKKIEILPFRIEDFELSAAMEYYVSTSHWLNALTPDLENHINELAIHIQKIFEKQKENKIIQNVILAKQFYEVQNYFDAKKHFEIVKKLDGENKEAIHYLNEIERQEREKFKSIKTNLMLCMDALEEKNPIQARLYVNNVFELDKENEKAKELEKAVKKLEIERQKMISENIDAGKKAFQSKRFNQAIKYFTEVLDLDKNNREIGELYIKSKNLQNEKQKKIAELLNSGKKALDAKDYSLSIKHFKAVLELENENEQALTCLTEIDREEKKRKIKVAETLTLGKRLLKSGYRTKAKELLEEVLKLDTKNKEALRLLNELHFDTFSSEKRTMFKKGKTFSFAIGLVIIIGVGAFYYYYKHEQTPETVSSGKNENITQVPDDSVILNKNENLNKLINLTEESIKQKDLSGAKNYLEQVDSFSPRDPHAKELKALITDKEEQINKCLNSGSEAQANKEYRKAMKYYSAILEIDKNNVVAHSKIELLNNFVKEQTEKILFLAHESLKNLDISKAKMQYLEVLNMDPENNEANDALTKINIKEKQIQQLIGQYDGAIGEKHYDEAEAHLRQILQIDAKNQKALKAIEEIKPFSVEKKSKALSVVLKNKSLEFSPYSGNDINFGNIKEKETIYKTIEVLSNLDKKIEFGLSGCNWENKIYPVGMKPNELFDSQLLRLKPHESNKLQIRLSMPEGTKLPGGKYSGQLIFKDLKGEYNYKISFYFTLIP